MPIAEIGAHLEHKELGCIFRRGVCVCLCTTRSSMAAVAEISELESQLDQVDKQRRQSETVSVTVEVILISRRTWREQSDRDWQA